MLKFLVADSNDATLYIKKANNYIGIRSQTRNKRSDAIQTKKGLDEIPKSRYLVPSRDGTGAVSAHIDGVIICKRVNQ